MSSYTQLYIYLFVLLFSFVCSIILKNKDKSNTLLCILLGLTLANELVAYFAAKKFGNNLIVYHSFSPIQFFVVALYFNYNIPEFKKYNLGIYIGIAGIILGFINTFFIQGVNVFNSFYVLFEG